MATEKKLERNPIVVVLGHVDHGKTSLLDAVKNTSIQKAEPGGITQNIYIANVAWKDNFITFIDTPGHEVFGLMRVNGGKVADLAFLIVAADEGVKPQTLESIDIIKSNNMKYIVVITKCDTEGANPEKVKTELMTRGVYLEGMGGDVPVVETSAVTKKGIDSLLDLVYLFSDVEDLLSEETEKLKLMEAYGDLTDDVTVHGVVLDSTIDKALGKQVFGVLRMGSIKKGDVVMFGADEERVGLLFDANKKPIKEVTAGMAFIATGLNELPMTGVDILMTKSDKLVNHVKKLYRIPETKGLLTSEELMDAIFADEHEFVIPVILRTDVKASLLSILPSFEKFTTENVKVKVVSSGVGGITMGDVDQAKTFRAILVGFRVKVTNAVKKYAQQEDVDISTFNIVYQLYDMFQEYIKKATSGGEVHEEVMGEGKIKKVFVLSDGEIVAGTAITDGLVRRRNIARVMREGKVIGDYFIHSLKVVKEEKKEVKKGFDCGINLGKEADLQEGDTITFISK